MRIIKKQSAWRDIEVIVDYIARENPAAAQQFIQTLQRHFELLAQFPMHGVVFHSRHPQLQHIRKAVLPAFRHYMLLYRPAADGIEIIRVLHTARNIQAILDHAR